MKLETHSPNRSEKTPWAGWIALHEDDDRQELRRLLQVFQKGSRASSLAAQGKISLSGRGAFGTAIAVTDEGVVISSAVPEGYEIHETENASRHRPSSTGAAVIAVIDEGVVISSAVPEGYEIHETEIASRHRPSSTGAAVADARRLLWKARSLDMLLKVARLCLLSKISDRLDELRNLPYDANEGEKPIDPDSVRWFLDYCMRRGVKQRPIITATPDGMVQGDWRRGAKERVSIRFFPDGLAWVALRTPQAHGSIEVQASLLLTHQSPVRIPDWA